MQIGFEGESIVTVSSLPDGLLAQTGPMISNGQFPGQCNPAAYITGQQAASLTPTGMAGYLAGINAWVNDNKLLAVGVIALAYAAAKGKKGK